MSGIKFSHYQLVTLQLELVYQSSPSKKQNKNLALRKWAVRMNFDLWKERVKRELLGGTKHKYPGFPRGKKERKRGKG